ncbi:MAG: class I SAM-dependent RNA methyltransferase [Acidimicrobiaceae bacterium]|nr:class I SAM-dependent RNA methyltransferase [Acidimicrobiaceae bacterium]
MELRVTATARDGVGVARGCDGRVVFGEGALPGELVPAEVHTVDRRWARARVIEVLEESPNRVPIACEHHLEGCGGCDMLHVDSRAQMRMKASIVVDQLTRHGVDAPAPALRMLDADRGRTTVRAKVVDGRAGFMARSSHEVVIPEDCGAVDDGAEELLVEGRYGPADGVFIRVGSRTGERMVVVNPTVDEVAVPDDVMVVGTDELDSDRRAWIHEELSGRRWRISARSFFQNRPAGAEALIDEVAEMVEDLATDGPLVDAYAGVGLFAGTAGSGRKVTAIERSVDAAADARINLGEGAKVLRIPVEKWRASPASVLVADPARSGIGEAAVRPLLSCKPRLVVLVSCDPSSFAKDAGRLIECGYTLDRWTVVDLFPLTSHIETVAAFIATA